MVLFKERKERRWEEYFILATSYNYWIKTYYDAEYHIVPRVYADLFSFNCSLNGYLRREARYDKDYLEKQVKKYNIPKYFYEEYLKSIEVANKYIREKMDKEKEEKRQEQINLYKAAILELKEEKNNE